MGTVRSKKFSKVIPQTERDIETKKVFQISIWEATLGLQYAPLPYLKKNLIAPLQVAILKKILLHYINRKVTLFYTL
jgi:hypothetical protein